MARGAWALLVLMLAGCGQPPPPPPKPEAAREVKILHFYASPSLIAAGDRTLICYGVENARAVRIEPPVEALTPVFNRCVPVAPARDTTYQLIAEGDGGRAVSQRIAIHVEPRRAAPPKPKPAAPGLIVSLAASATEVARGAPVTVCYQVAAGASVRVEPETGLLKPGEKACFNVTPQQTTTYTVTASAGARSERQALTIRVW